MKIDFISDGTETDQLTNINVAKALIEHESTYHNIIFNTDNTRNTFNVEDLEEIANHLLVYCKYERMRYGYTEEQK